MFATKISPRPTVRSHKPVRTASLIKSITPTSLPDIPIKHHRAAKKRVRFEMKLESVDEKEEDEHSYVSNYENPPMIQLNSTKQIDNGKPFISVVQRPSSNTFLNHDRSPDLVISLFAVTTSPFHLPTIAHQTTTNRMNNNNERRHSLTFVDSSLKQQVHLPNPPRSFHSRRIFNLPNMQPTTRQINLTLSITKESNENDKLIRTNSFGGKTINEYLQMKRTY